MSRFERDVREMLHRRAGDIDGLAASPSLDRSRARRRAPLLVAAAAAFAAGALTFSLWTGKDDTADVTTRPESTIAPDAPTTTGPTDADARPDAPAVDAARPAPPADWRALLPSGFAPESAASLHHSAIELDDHPAPTHEAVSRYLESRLADLVARTDVEIETLDETPTISAHHVVFGVDGRWVGHVIVTRRSESGVDVVASVADSVDVTDLRRTAAGVEGSVPNPMLDLLAAEVLGPDGSPVADSPFPAGLTGSEPRFATAGSADGTISAARPATLELDVPLNGAERWPVVVLLRHVGGTWLSLTEFALRPPALAGLCADATPPHAIGLGDWFGARTTGANAESVWPALEGQQREHALGDFGSIELLWPPSPEWLDQIGRQRESEPSSMARSNGRGTIDIVIGSGADPCAWTQVVLEGDPVAMGWFADAITGIWGVLRTAPDLATLDPEDLERMYRTAGGSDTTDPALVIGTVETAAGVAPIPERGSCDGLPDAPPQRGGPAGVTGATPEAALEAFLATGPGDPPLLRAGYLQVTRSGATVAFVIEGHTFPITTINVAEANDGTWTIVSWEAAAC